VNRNRELKKKKDGIGENSTGMEFFLKIGVDSIAEWSGMYF